MLGLYKVEIYINSNWLLVVREDPCYGRVMREQMINDGGKFPIVSKTTDIEYNVIMLYNGVSQCPMSTMSPSLTSDDLIFRKLYNL